MRNHTFLGLGVAAILTATSLGCVGQGQGPDSNAAVEEDVRVQPGHGSASIGEQLDPNVAAEGDDQAGTEGDDEDTGEDLETEATAEQQPAPTREAADEQAVTAAEPGEPPAEEGGGDGIGQGGQALSTTTGTTFDLTYYVIALRPKGDANTYTIRDCNGKFLTYASSAFRADANMQGTARFRTSSGESKTINAGPGCWISLPYSQRWGLGVTNPATNKAFALRPFRSIAVDRNVLSIGKWYYIKQLDGVRMPYPNSTMTHDGCVRAVDVGSAVGGRHIDWYVGYRSAYKSLIGGSSTMGGRETVTLYSGTNKCAKHIERGY